MRLHSLNVFLASALQRFVPGSGKEHQASYLVGWLHTSAFTHSSYLPIRVLFSIKRQGGHLQFYILGACCYFLAGGGIVSCIILGVYHLYYGLLRTDDRAQASRYMYASNRGRMLDMGKSESELMAMLGAYLLAIIDEMVECIRCYCVLLCHYKYKYLIHLEVREREVHKES
jgi:hypothetical protein